MTKEYKQAYLDALSNAAEMIRGHVEVGYVHPNTDNGVYKKACYKVYDILIKKYHKLQKRKQW